MAKLTKEQRAKIIEFRENTLKPLLEKHKDTPRRLTEEDYQTWLDNLKANYHKMNKQERLDYLMGRGRYKDGDEKRTL